MIAVWLAEAKAAMMNIDKEVSAALIGAFFGSIFSFVLLVVWHAYLGRRERLRSVRLVREEVDANLALLASNQNALRQEIEGLGQGEHLLGALPQLTTEAWQTTLLTDGGQSKKLRPLARTYRRITILNQRLQARELFKATSQAIRNYNVQLIGINEVLLESGDKITEALTRHRSSLWGWRMTLGKYLDKRFGKKGTRTPSTLV